MGIFSKNIIVTNLCNIIPESNIFILGVMISEMSMAWVKTTCGRLESRYRYTKDNVYNNFPWPLKPSENNITKVKESAQKVLDIRDKYPDSSLADLYDPLTMPPDLMKAHKQLDKAVDLCYRPQPFPNDSSRLEFLFDLYQQYTDGLYKKEKKKKANKK